MSYIHKMIVLTAVLFVVVFLLYAPVAQAATQLEITADAVNVRSGPDTSYNKVATVKLGQTYPVLASKNGWYKIQVNNTLTGWVIDTYAKILSENDLPDHITISSGLVNIRSGPGTSYDKVGELKAGETLQVIGQSGDWYKVSLATGAAGYVANWLVQTALSGASTAGSTISSGGSTISSGGSTISDSSKPYKKGTVNTNNLNLRASPDSNAEKVTQLSQGTGVKVYERSGDWYRIVADNGCNGWVYATYITLFNVAVSAETIEAPERPVWDQESGVQGEIDLIFDTTDSGFTITMTSDIPIEYSLKKTSSSVSFVTDMAISGETPCVYGMEAQIEGESGQTLTVTGNSLYYDVDKEDEGRKLILMFGISPLVGKLIYLDPGHGVINSSGILDPGACGSSGLQEKDVVYAIALKTKALLEDMGAQVVMTRGKTTYLTLYERAAIANSAGADIFVSIHTNSSTSSSTNGTSTWLYAPSGNSAYDRAARVLLAQKIQTSLLYYGGRANLGLQESNFVVIRETAMPSVLVETAFISNATEQALLASDSFQQKMAKGIAEGIKAYFLACE